MERGIQPQYKDFSHLQSSSFYVYFEDDNDVGGGAQQYQNDDAALAARGYGDILRYARLLERPAFEFRLARGTNVLRASAPGDDDTILMWVRRPLTYTRRTHDYVFPWQLDDTLRFFGRSTREYIFDGRLDAIALRDDEATGRVYVQVTHLATPEAEAVLRPALEKID